MDVLSEVSLLRQHFFLLRVSILILVDVLSEVLIVCINGSFLLVSILILVDVLSEDFNHSSIRKLF